MTKEVKFNKTCAKLRKKFHSTYLKIVNMVDPMEVEVVNPEMLDFLNKEISILEDDKKMNYLDVIKTTLESHYKRAGITYNIKIEDNYLFVKLIYDKNKYYILDDLYILKNDSGININFISEDNDGNYASISLSKQYKYKNMIKIIEKADYKCK